MNMDNRFQNSFNRPLNQFNNIRNRPFNFNSRFSHRNMEARVPRSNFNNEYYLNSNFNRNLNNISHQMLRGSTRHPGFDFSQSNNTGGNINEDPCRNMSYQNQICPNNNFHNSFFDSSRPRMHSPFSQKIFSPILCSNEFIHPKMYSNKDTSMEQTPPSNNNLNRDFYNANNQNLLIHRDSMYEGSSIQNFEEKRTLIPHVNKNNIQDPDDLHIKLKDNIICNLDIKKNINLAHLKDYEHEIKGNTQTDKTTFENKKKFIFDNSETLNIFKPYIYEYNVKKVDKQTLDEADKQDLGGDLNLKIEHYLNINKFVDKPIDSEITTIKNKIKNSRSLKKLKPLLVKSKLKNEITDNVIVQNSLVDAKCAKEVVSSNIEKNQSEFNKKNIHNSFSKDLKINVENINKNFPSIEKNNHRMFNSSSNKRYKNSIVSSKNHDYYSDSEKSSFSSDSSESYSKRYKKSRYSKSIKRYNHSEGYERIVTSAPCKKPQIRSGPNMVAPIAGKASFTKSSAKLQNPNAKEDSLKFNESKFGPSKMNSKIATMLDDPIEESNNTEDLQRIKDDILELEQLMELTEDPLPSEWVRSSPANLYFQRDQNAFVSTKRMNDLKTRFEVEILGRAERVRASKPVVVVNMDNEEIDEEINYLSEDDKNNDNNDVNKIDHKSKSITDWKDDHPERLHPQTWFNYPGEMNVGKLCKCSVQNRKHGIRHNIYPGERLSPKCVPDSNNADKLFQYHVTMSPHTNFLTSRPSIIEYDGHEYIFEGFSLLSHYKLEKIPDCKVIRFNIEYTIHWTEEATIDSFDVRSLDLFSDYIFGEILELVDLDWVYFSAKNKADHSLNLNFENEEDEEQTNKEHCRCFHIMPRFSRSLPDNGKEILAMSEVLKFLIDQSQPMFNVEDLPFYYKMDEAGWNDIAQELKGSIVTKPGSRPSSLRVDQIAREPHAYPHIVHFGHRPSQLSYVGDAKYNKSFKQYMKFKYLVANKPKLTIKDRTKLKNLETSLLEIRRKVTLKREVTVEVSCEGFYQTGLRADICQHALLLPVLLQHLRFHRCLDSLENSIGYSFKDRLLLQMSMTHPSFRLNFGTNPDHARNSLTNCGMRQLEYGERHVHYMHTRKRGINTLMHIMSKMARLKETASHIHHYERLEFLGDTVIEFLSSVHLFFIFPNLEEGGLATYRAALVQNQHLTVLAEKLGLQHYLLYAHGPDLCRDLDLRYALANCFEALMGSLFLDGGIEVADKIFGEALFKGEDGLLEIWENLPSHPLQEDEPLGDRHWISKSKPLQKLTTFEDMTGIVFNHIRLLARAFTMRNIGLNHLTLGHNQTLEFLGDTILQFVTSEYLYKHFPDHHEGHLTLLRSSLVNNRTQAILCDDLAMINYVINNDIKVQERIENEKNKVKDKADILEAFIGALYVDQGLLACHVFCKICLYPRLTEFIINQEWNDSKSQLQQCCLTLREPTDGEPDIPIYKVLQTTGPTNTRKYNVGVYFRGDRLASGVGHSVQLAEMDAAAKALKEKAHMFPHLLHTKQYLDWRFAKFTGERIEGDHNVNHQNKRTFRGRLTAKWTPRKKNN